MGVAVPIRVTLVPRRMLATVAASHGCLVFAAC